jgi:hypothetical protein
MLVPYTKIVGKPLRLNPLAVTLSLLFLVWIWGGMGLILAVPLVGATKICDHVDSLRGLGLIRRLSPLAHDFGWQSWYLPATSIAGEYAVVLKARDAQMDARSSQAPEKDATGGQRRARSCSAATRLL